jgi:diaminohydroxyphosphoribosylaminopyrimidine deaminase / 5-amino-6-(5-phosphoribosylamino)uracil reductase
VRLLQVGARYAEFASWLNQDSGNVRAATHWADRAMEWAQEVGNLHMVSYVLVRKSDQAAATRDAPRTIGLAQSALQHGRRLTSRGRAVALQQLAVGYALAGNEVACQRALDTAAQLAERSQLEQDEGPGRYCTPAYVEIQRAATWIELGRPERAIDLFEDSLARLPSVHRRDRGVYLARLASAYALSGSPDTSVPKGWEALTVAQATGSRRITTELGQLGSRLARWESMAAADGSSKWITSAEARADGHRLRAECGAVMVGSGTQQADDPQLAVRDAEVTRQPLRIVVDSNARTPAAARVLDDAAPTLIAVADDADASHLEGRAEIVRLPRVDAGLDLELLLKALSERGVRAILLEGGPTLAGSFLAAGLIDRVVAYIAPVLIGGGGKPALAGPGALNIADAKRFQLQDVVRIGPDVRLTATPLS